MGRKQVGKRWSTGLPSESWALENPVPAPLPGNCLVHIQGSSAIEVREALSLSQGQAGPMRREDPSHSTSKRSLLVESEAMQAALRVCYPGRASCRPGCKSPRQSPSFSQ